MIIHRPFNFSYIENGIFYKVSKSERLADEIFYYQQIQNKCSNYFAEFIGDFSNGENYILGLKYYENYLNLFEFIEKCPDYDHQKLLDSLLGVLNLIHNIYQGKNKINNTHIFIDKTINEYEKFLIQNDFQFKELLLADTITINNNKYNNFIKIWDSLKNLININYQYSENTIIHGDFCFANILINPIDYDIKLIDPRGSYKMRGCFGNASYDYAKLFHSIFGNYESIIYNQFDLKKYYNTIFELRINKKHQKLEKLLTEKINFQNFNEYKLIEGLLFISMCSRHYENQDHQLAMYLQGVMILNNFLNY